MNQLKLTELVKLDKKNKGIGLILSNYSLYCNYFKTEDMNLKTVKELQDYLIQLTNKKERYSHSINNRLVEIDFVTTMNDCWINDSLFIYFDVSIDCNLALELSAKIYDYFINNHSVTKFDLIMRYC